MPWFLTLAWRYFRSGRQHPFIRVIRRVSMLGVALGVTALIVVISVMHGFESDLKKKIVGTTAHATIEAGSGFEAGAEWQSDFVAKNADVIALSPFVEGQVLLKRKKEVRGALLRGADAAKESAVSSIAEYLSEGRFPQEGNLEMMVGHILADSFRLSVGDSIELISPETRKPKKVSVVGIFKTGMYEYDAHLVYTPLDFAQNLYVLGEGVSGVALKYSSAEQAIQSKDELQRYLGFPFYVRTWKDMNRNLFGALELERNVMFVILALIVMVACFNIIGTLTLLVIDKTKDIGILKALGASRGHVMGIFTLHGCLIGLSGTVLGVLMGLGLCHVLERFPLIEIPQDIYYFDRLPVDTRWPDVAAISLCAFVLSLISTIYPAVSASRLKTVDAVKYQG